MFESPRKKIGLDPDEILIDAKNISPSDSVRFHGTMERAVGKKTFVFLAVAFLLVGLVFLGQIVRLQFIKGDAYAARSQDNNLRQSNLYPSRGVIYDRNEVILATNDPKRSYLQKSGIGHVVGYVGFPDESDLEEGVFSDPKEIIGKAGVERYYNDLLCGIKGLKIEEVDVSGQIVSESTQANPTDGENLYLTIDYRIQEKLYEFIKGLANDRGFLGGAGIIMDVNTGEILALTNYPEFGLSLLSRGQASSEDVAKLFSDKRTPFLNRAVNGQYAPGSIIKPFVAIGALSEGVIVPEKKILSTGSISIPNPYFPEEESIFSDWKAHGWVNLKQAIAASSNVYFFEVGGGYKNQKGIGIHGIETYTRLFGFGEKTGIDLIEEGGGVIPNPDWKEKTFDGDPWRIGDTYNTAIGQYGFVVTPIQVVRAVAALANKGKLLTPFIASTDKNFSKKPRDIAIPERHFNAVAEGMRLGAINGTASALGVPFVKVSAKTGTAELGFTKAKVNSWVTGYFPSDDPKYAFVVVMEKGSRSNLVGAVFVMRQLLEWMAEATPEYLK